MTTTTELRKMQSNDLEKEIREQSVLVAKLRMGVKLGKEKDSAKYQREHKQLARMTTIMTEKRTEELLEAASTPTVSARTTSNTPSAS